MLCCFLFFVVLFVFVVDWFCLVCVSLFCLFLFVGLFCFVCFVCFVVVCFFVVACVFICVCCFCVVCVLFARLRYNGVTFLNMYSFVFCSFVKFEKKRPRTPRKSVSGFGLRILVSYLCYSITLKVFLRPPGALLESPLGALWVPTSLAC